MKTKLILLFSLFLVLPARAGLLPNDALVEGKTIGEWSAEWWKWAYSVPTSQNPLMDTTGAWAANGQPAGDVFFLAGVYSIANTVTRTITVPEGKYFFFPVINVEVGLDPTDPPAIEERQDLARALIDIVTEIHASIDGATVPDLRSHRAQSPVFSFELTFPDNIPSLIRGFPVVGLFDSQVADGYYLMLEPLPPGPHVIQFGGRVDLGDVTVFQLEITYLITVEPVPLSDRVANLLSQLAAGSLSPKREGALAVSLKAARASFEAGHVQPGIHQLRAFQNKVRAQVEPFNSTLAEELIQSAQGIIERAGWELKKVPNPLKGAGPP